MFLRDTGREEEEEKRKKKKRKSTAKINTHKKNKNTRAMTGVRSNTCEAPRV